MYPTNLTAPPPCLAKPSPIVTPNALLFAAGSFKVLERCGWSHLTRKQSLVTCKANLRAHTISLSTSGLWKNYQELRSSTYAGKQLPATSSPFMVREHANSMCFNLTSRKHRRSFIPPRAAAYNDVFKFRYPIIKEKPDWMWRTVASVPYLIALQISDAGYFIQRFVDHYEVFENILYFLPGINRLPPWFAMVYCYFAYVGIVKNKDWPHFIRFHLMMGMLLETALQLVWYIGNFFPLIHYDGMFGINVWAGVAVFYILVLLECVRCALSGKYAHIPLVSEAAYIHTLFNIGRFQKPF